MRLGETLGHLIDVVRQDLGYAVRGLCRSPGFTATIVITLALGIGANAAVFGVLDRVYFGSPPGVADAGSVRRVTQYLDAGASPTARPSWFSYLSIPDLADLAAASRGLARVEGYSARGVVPVGAAGEPASLAAVTAGFFDMLGVRAGSGRLFLPEEARLGEARLAAVLSHRFWTAELGADPAVIGTGIAVQGRSYTVVGIAQRGFDGIDLDGVDVWVPLAALLGGGAELEGGAFRRGSGAVTLLARLSPGVNDRAVEERLTLAFRQGNAAESWFSPRAAIALTPLLEARGPEGLGGLNDRGLALALRLGGMAIVVLLVAAANVASLLLMRAHRRRREIAVRLTLGVSRRRLLGQLLAESALLALLASAAAVLLASLTGSALRVSLLSGIRWSAPIVGGRVVVFVLIAGLIAGLVAGIAPAITSLRMDINSVLKAGAPEAGGPGARVRIGLLVTQVALCMALLAGGGLFLQSLRRAQDTKPGFDDDRLVTASISLRRMTRGDADAAMARIRALPWVEAVAGANMDLQPPPPGNQRPVWTAEGDTLRGLRAPAGGFVDQEYAGVAGLELASGRHIGPSDGLGSEPVVVVTAALARELSRVGAVGSCLYTLYPADVCRRVIGVVRDIRFNVSEPAPLVYFVPTAQGPPSYAPHRLLVRARGPLPSDAAAQVEATLRDVFAGGRTHLVVRTVRERMDPLLRPWRVAAALFSLFGILALVSAAAGIYGLISFDVTNRTRELGVRVAIGATPSAILKLVVRDGLRVVAIGLGVGIVVAMLGGRVVAALLYDTSPLDPAALIGTAGLLTLVTTVASVIPGLRAARLDPVRALRAE